MSRSYSRAIIFVLFSIVLGACASRSIPSFDVSKSVLVIPVDLNNRSAESWVRKYKIILTDAFGIDREVLVPVSADQFIVLDDLPAGEYRIEKYIGFLGSMKWRSVGDAKRGHEYTVKPINLELVEGKLTVLPNKFTVEQTDAGGYIHTGSSFETLTQEQYEQFVETVLAGNEASWPISELKQTLIPVSSQNLEAVVTPSLTDSYILAHSNKHASHQNWSDWLALDEFEALVDDNKSMDLYPSEIEGKYDGGLHWFRAAFLELAEGRFEWAANWQMSKRQLLERDTHYLARGYKRLSNQEYNGLDRYLHKHRDHYQTVWIRWFSP